MLPPPTSDELSDWLGVVAYQDQQPVGAAWLRLLPDSDPGYGFMGCQHT